MLIRLVFAGDDGLLYDHRSLGATGRTGDRIVEVADEDLIEMPRGASLALVPGGSPVGIDRAGNFTAMSKNPYLKGKAWAVGALLPQGYTRTLLPPYKRGRTDRPLPLLGYAAVAFRNGKLYVAASRTDNPRRWDPDYYNTADLPALVRKKREQFPANRILGQLAHCALNYQCFTAQNIFYRRWEGGLPVAPACNARCLGCISLQPSDCCPAPQARIDFSPTSEEVAELAVPHLKGGKEAMVSFGQGCEGEPALAYKTIVGSINKIRSETSQGTINMNSNGGYTAGVEEICRAGLDAVRVSLISAREETYHAYCRPANYSLADVRRSIKKAAELGVYTSLNLLVFPGLTDRAGELAALLELIRETGVKLVQLRNLNIDPDFLFQQMPASGDDLLGVPALIQALKETPGLAVGSFSKPVRQGLTL